VAKAGDIQAGEPDNVGLAVGGDGPMVAVERPDQVPEVRPCGKVLLFALIFVAQAPCNQCRAVPVGLDHPSSVIDVLEPKVPGLALDYQPLGSPRRV
jgi:hypothetical protein